MEIKTKRKKSPCTAGTEGRSSGREQLSRLMSTEDFPPRNFPMSKFWFFRGEGDQKKKTTTCRGENIITGYSLDATTSFIGSPGRKVRTASGE